MITQTKTTWALDAPAPHQAPRVMGFTAGGEPG